MKSVLDKATRDEIISRINCLSENSKAEWGKMNVHQMLKHCALAEEFYLGKSTHKRAFMGRIFGKMALKSMIKDETPVKRNMPTSPAFIPTEDSGELTAEKARWAELIEEYANFPEEGMVHFFFGKMTKEQTGYFVYKHADHHLRQFNC